MTFEERLARAHRKMTSGTLAGRSRIAQRQRLRPQRVQASSGGEWCGSPPGTQSPFGTGSVNMHDSVSDNAGTIDLSGLSTSTATVLEFTATRTYTFTLSVTFELITAPAPGEDAAVEASWGLFDGSFSPVDGASSPTDTLMTVGEQTTIVLSGSFAADPTLYFVPGIAGEGIGSTYVSRVVAGSLCVQEA